MTDLIERLRAAYLKVAEWPERRMPGVDITTLGEGFMDLLTLRNLVSDFLEAAALESVSPAPGEPVALPFAYDFGLTMQRARDAIVHGGYEDGNAYLDEACVLLGEGLEAWAGRRASPPTSPGEPPKGWKLAPEEPTEAMLDAGVMARIESIDQPNAVANIYEAMLAAAPSPGSAE